MRGSRPVSAARIAGVRSVEPSSTTTISRRIPPGRKGGQTALFVPDGNEHRHEGCVFGSRPLGHPRQPDGRTQDHAYANEAPERAGPGGCGQEAEDGRHGCALPALESGATLLQESRGALPVVRTLESRDLEAVDLGLLADAAVLDDGLDDPLGAPDGQRRVLGHPAEIIVGVSGQLGRGEDTSAASRVRAEKRMSFAPAGPTRLTSRRTEWSP